MLYNVLFNVVKEKYVYSVTLKSYIFSISNENVIWITAHVVDVFVLEWIEGYAQVNACIQMYYVKYYCSYTISESPRNKMAPICDLKSNKAQ